MVDFETNALVLKKAGINVAAASVDSVETTASLGEGLRVSYVKMFGEVDVHAVAEATGANIQDDEQRTILHATGFLLSPSGKVVQSVYASGPIGRFVCNDILKIVAFLEAQRAG